MRVVTSTDSWRVYRQERVVLAALIGCLSLLIQCTAIPIQFPLEPTPISEVSLAAQHQEIAFNTTMGSEARWRVGNLFLMSADGESQVALGGSRTAIGDITPSWARDGAAIAFAEILSVPTPECGTGLVIMHEDGSTEIMPCVLNAAWSPDNQSLAFYQYRPYSRIIQVNEQTRDTKILVDGLKEYKYGIRLSWSPDGQELAYELQDAKDNWGIHIVNQDGTGARHLTRGSSPDWSPNRHEIAFDYQGKIWVINSDGSDLRSITDGPGDQSPSWSPNGEELVFGSARESEGNIYRVRRDGTNLKRLTFNRAWSGRPAWRPIAK